VILKDPGRDLNVFLKLNAMYTRVSKCKKNKIKGEKKKKQY
jgi:hypothetical protein